MFSENRMKNQKTTTSFSSHILWACLQVLLYSSSAHIGQLEKHDEKQQ